MGSSTYTPETRISTYTAYPFGATPNFNPSIWAIIWALPTYEAYCDGQQSRYRHIRHSQGVATEAGYGIPES